MTNYKEIIKGPLSELGRESDKDWEKAANLNWELNNCSPSEKDKKEEILNELIGEIGENTMICTPFYCNLGYPIKIGNGCFININCVFLDPEKIEIGDNTLLGPGVQIYTANHPADFKERVVPIDEKFEDKNYNYIDDNGNFNEEIEYTFTNFAQEVKIGKNCWIGGQSIILPGVTIGNNVTIGAGSTVTRDIPDNSVAVGSPARVIKKLGK